MARKDLLKGLMSEPQNEAATSRDGTARPRYTSGAIGAVSKSIADLKKNSVVEIDPFAVADSGLKDRLEHDEEDHAALMASLKEYGQQVPVLVRPYPEDPGRYQIVYGHRRVLALRDLGMPVKAMVRDLDDRAMVVAQGQENTSRKDLSFIEKTNFARQMVEAGYPRKVIIDALSIDKTVISRMLSIAERVPVEVIEAVGSAPDIGRDRWARFAELWTQADCDVGDIEAMLAVSPVDSSDDRFDMLFNWLSGTRAPSPAPATSTEVRPLTSRSGKRMGKMTKGKSSTVIHLNRAASDGFADWLAENIEEVHRDWEASQGE